MWSTKPLTSRRRLLRARMKTVGMRRSDNNVCKQYKYCRRIVYDWGCVELECGVGREWRRWAGECELGVFGYTASSLEHSMSAQRSLTYEEDDDVMFGKVVLSSCVKHMVKSCAGTTTKARTCWGGRRLHNIHHPIIIRHSVTILDQVALRLTPSAQNL